MKDLLTLFTINLIIQLLIELDCYLKIRRHNTLAIVFAVFFLLLDIATYLLLK